MLEDSHGSWKGEAPKGQYSALLMEFHKEQELSHVGTYIILYPWEPM
jgi:hypothetical protein